jgi:hypothetical protein
MRTAVTGIDHLGINADSEEQLASMRAGLRARDLTHVEQHAAACCYARADNLWVTDPNGIPEELYTGKGSIEVFGDDVRPVTREACCADEADRSVLLFLSPKQRP